MSHKTNCGTCGGVIMLLKDSTEGQQVFHGGECYQKHLQEKDMKYTKLDSPEIPIFTENTHKVPEATSCQNCFKRISMGDRYWTWMSQGENGLVPTFICCDCKKLI